MEKTLEIFADFACPWCYFMVPNIERLKNEYKIKTKWRAYAITPDIAFNGERLSKNELQENIEQKFESLAKEQNLPWTNNRVQRFQTQSAHIISKWADENNIGDTYRQTVYYYYFVLQKNIALPDVLTEIIIRLGMYEVKPKYILEDEKYIKLVEKDLEMGSDIEISGVPAIIYNDKIINGFVKYDELKKFITKSVNKLNGV